MQKSTGFWWTACILITTTIVVVVFDRKILNSKNRSNLVSSSSSVSDGFTERHGPTIQERRLPREKHTYDKKTREFREEVKEEFEVMNSLLSVLLDKVTKIEKHMADIQKVSRKPKEPQFYVYESESPSQNHHHEEIPIQEESIITDNSGDMFNKDTRFDRRFDKVLDSRFDGRFDKLLDNRFDSNLDRRFDNSLDNRFDRNFDKNLSIPFKFKQDKFNTNNINKNLNNGLSNGILLNYNLNKHEKNNNIFGDKPFNKIKPNISEIYYQDNQGMDPVIESLIGKQMGVLEQDERPTIQVPGSGSGIPPSAFASTPYTPIFPETTMDNQARERNDEKEGINNRLLRTVTFGSYEDLMNYNDEMAKGKSPSGKGILNSNVVRVGDLSKESLEGSGPSESERAFLEGLLNGGSERGDLLSDAAGAPDELSGELAGVPDGLLGETTEMGGLADGLGDSIQDTVKGSLLDEIIDEAQRAEQSGSSLVGVSRSEKKKEKATKKNTEEKLNESKSGETKESESSKTEGSQLGKTPLRLSKAKEEKKNGKGKKKGKNDTNGKILEKINSLESRINELMRSKEATNKKSGKAVEQPGSMMLLDSKNILGESKKMLGDNKKKFSDSKNILGDSKKMLGNGKKMIGDGKKMVGDGKQMVGDGKKMLGNSKKMLGDKLNKTNLPKAKELGTTFGKSLKASLLTDSKGGSEGSSRVFTSAAPNSKGNILESMLSKKSSENETDTFEK